MVPQARLPRLLFAGTGAQIEADYAVLIAHAHGREVAIHVILALNDLLRSLSDIGGVEDGDVIDEFLLDGDLRAVADGVGLSSQALRIDLDVAGSEQALEAVADGGVQCLTEDLSGRLV